MHDDYQSDSGRGTFFDNRSLSKCVSNSFYLIPYLSLVTLTLKTKVQLIDLEELAKTSKRISTKRIVATPAKDSVALGRRLSPILQFFSSNGFTHLVFKCLLSHVLPISGHLCECALATGSLSGHMSQDHMWNWELQLWERIAKSSFSSSATCILARG